MIILTLLLGNKLMQSSFKLKILVQGQQQALQNQLGKVNIKF